MGLPSSFRPQRRDGIPTKIDKKAQHENTAPDAMFRQTGRRRSRQRSVRYPRARDASRTGATCGTATRPADRDAPFRKHVRPTALYGSGEPQGAQPYRPPGKRNSLPMVSDRQHRRSEAGQARRPRYRPSLRRPKRIAKADKRRTAFRCVRHRPNDIPMQRLRLLRCSIRSVSGRRTCPNGKTGQAPKAGT